MKRDKFLITTTESINHVDIEKYIDLVSAHVVIGANLFSDFGASITDIFGGYADTYQKKISLIYQTAINKLKQSAMEIGANAIVGLKVDMDEISGKGKSMFMVTAVGTAVSVSVDKSNQLIALSNVEMEGKIGMEELHNEFIKRLIISKVQNNQLPNEEEWSFLLNYPIGEITEKLLDKYLSNSETDTLLSANISTYIERTDKRLAIDIVYDKVKNSAPSRIILDLIKENRLFDPVKVRQLVQDKKYKFATACLEAEKDFYVKSDLEEMKTLLGDFDSLPEVGHIEFVKGVFSKGEEKYICPRGHKNNKDVQYCENVELNCCGLNIRSLTIDQVNQIELFRKKIEALEYLLERE